jgi:hypothetical protein
MQCFDEHMHDNSFDTSQICRKVAITLDGRPVELPAGHRSLSAIRCYLETLALERQRILCSLRVDGECVNLALPLTHSGAFYRVEAVTAALKETSVLLLKTALQQTEYLQKCVETAITLVLINDGCVAHEIWWNLAKQLKDPVFTLSLLPDDACGPVVYGASPTQLRQWQLEQIAVIIRDVDKACQSKGTIPLSDALENRVLPWLQKLGELISLWHETVLAGLRLGITNKAA